MYTNISQKQPNCYLFLENLNITMKRQFFYTIYMIYLYPDEAILQRKLQGYIPAILPTEYVA